MSKKTPEENAPSTAVSPEAAAPPQLPAVLSPEATAFFQILERAARDPSVDVGKMKALLEMKEGVENREAEKAWALAMQATQAEILPVAKNAQNAHTKSKYAKLEKVDEAIRPIYTKHGFSISYGSREPKGQQHVRVVCHVSHIGGYSKEFELEGRLDTTGSQGASNKTEIQGMGSSVSYLRRYLLLMIFNVVMEGEDADGNGKAPLISADQSMQIDAQLQLYDDTYKKKFLDYMRVGKVTEILARDFKRAMNALDAKAKEIKK